jgi:hypothetical protein
MGDFGKVYGRTTDQMKRQATCFAGITILLFEDEIEIAALLWQCRGLFT